MSVVINEVLRRTSAMSAERRQQRFYEVVGKDYLEQRRESARLSRAGGVAAAAESEDGPVGEDQVHTHGAEPAAHRHVRRCLYDATDGLVEEDDESEDQIVPGLFRTSLCEAKVRCPSDLGHLHCACPSAQTWVTCTAEGRAWARSHARTILVGARESAQVSQRSQAQSASQPRVLNRTRDARAARSPRSLTDWCVAQSVPDPSVLLCGQGLALPSLRASLTPATR